MNATTLTAQMNASAIDFLKAPKNVEFESIMQTAEVILIAASEWCNG